MRNLLEYPITAEEVIEFLTEQVKLEEILSEVALAVGSTDSLKAKIALEVVMAASTIVQNDIGSTAADLLANAFQSQNIPAMGAATEVQLLQQPA